MKEFINLDDLFKKLDKSGDNNLDKDEFSKLIKIIDNNVDDLVS
jgi:Ca2+-binding EF-hand superfamily protein